MTGRSFEVILANAVSALSQAAQRGEQGFRTSKEFEQRVLDALKEAAQGSGLEARWSFHPHAFPDIRVNGFGVEVKHTTKDSWLSVGNSIFEGMRDEEIERIYVVFGKMGGWPEVRGARYEDCVTHVRISHAPRFVLEMVDPSQSLFNRIGVPYDAFRNLPPDAKMQHVRNYARSRLKPGERTWWLEEEHTVPIEVRLYRKLPDVEKRKLRGEAALLCPQICGPWTMRGKYDDAARYLLLQHGVFCPQARDLYSAGSVALRGNPERGGHYLQRALCDIEPQMREAAERLPDSLFEEYWGEPSPRGNRLAEWLKRADSFARDWTPSACLFKGESDA